MNDEDMRPGDAEPSESEQRVWRLVVYACLGLFFIVLGYIVVQILFTLLSKPLTASEEVAFLQVVLQTGGGLALLVALYNTVRTLQHNNQTLRLNEEGQNADRLMKAIDRLPKKDTKGQTPR